MNTLKQIFIAILALSCIVFCALFGSLPRFRKTPIGYINRLIWIQIPGTLLSIDRLITGGRAISTLKRIGNYLMNENHPLVLIFYLLIILTSQILFLPASWPHLSTLHHILLPPLILTPYILTYLTVTSTSSAITPLNHAQFLRHYPYDRILFHPGIHCTTCHFTKPARSKHCRICNVCVSKHDHHCVWVMNCIGRGNYGLFLAMLLSLGIELVYGAYLAHSILNRRLQTAHEAAFAREMELTAATVGGAGKGFAGKWWEGRDFWGRLDVWLGAFARDIRIGGVGLLAAFTAPLALGLLGYHLYLVWAGMTTSESFKWDEWRDDVADGLVYKREKKVERGKKGEGRVNGRIHAEDGVLVEEGGRVRREQVEASEDVDPYVPWPVEGKLRLVSRANRRSMEAEPDADLSRPEWVQVQSLAEVVNIYDLGFSDNLRDCFRLS